jgi:ferritin-like metal-binding protein YciE
VEPREEYTRKEPVFQRLFAPATLRLGNGASKWHTQPKANILEEQMETAREFLTHELSDMLDAERKILGILEEAQDEVSNEQLRKGLENHHKQTEGQIQRLEQCFEELGEEPQQTECKGIEGLKQEKEAFMEEDPSEDLVEIFTVGASAKIEHYEIAAYTSMIDLCTQLGLKKAVRLLQQNLHEEEQMLKRVEGFSKKLEPQETGMEEMEEEEAPKSHRRKAA